MFVKGCSRAATMRCVSRAHASVRHFYTGPSTRGSRAWHRRQGRSLCVMGSDGSSGVVMGYHALPWFVMGCHRSCLVDHKRLWCIYCNQDSWLYIYYRCIYHYITNDSKIQTFILRNKQLQREHNEMIVHLYICDQEICWIATLDYGQQRLVLNPFLNNKHQVIKFHTLYTNYVTFN